MTFTFPDEKMIEAFRTAYMTSINELKVRTLDEANGTDEEYWAMQQRDFDEAVAKGQAAALADFKARTGIDAGDVLAKLAAGTHKLVSVDDLAQIRAIAAANLVMNLTDRAAQEE